jgi:hypothetical protein
VEESERSFQVGDLHSKAGVENIGVPSLRSTSAEAGPHERTPLV